MNFLQNCSSKPSTSTYRVAAMAVRALQRRLGLFLRSNPPPQAQAQAHHRKDPSWQFVPSSTAFFNQYGFCKRGIQSQKEPISPGDEDLGNQDSGSVKPYRDLANEPSQIESGRVEYSAASNLRTSSRHDLAMIFTCKVCETRSVKTVCRESYEKGVVVVRCGGCNSLHLIADHLGWFGEPGSVEDFLAARGEEVKKGNTDTLSLTLEDLAGKKS
ncbi:Mitochondrial import protein TIM [Parasponia andersonii]|uniref:Mitochondrial import protein TIM n=1 Tax=Parasponia andersonii TaxID=3476 RepID=A0A2P5AGW8_PARAD|nr:Mitochondrial import protein TIM [Parasponia andersonii]